MNARARGLARRSERGIVLIMVLIGIIAMSLAGIALMRASQTGSLIAGNFAFKQASVAASDTAVEMAFAQLDTIVAGLSDAAYPAGCAVGACVYYPTRQATDINGMPNVIGNWSTVPSNVVNASYTTRYVIDRLCTGALPITDPTVSCFVGQALTAGGSRKIGDTNFSSAPQIHYRVSVQVTGPRNTVSLVQAIVAK